MPSTPYCSELPTDPGLRRAVVGSGIAAAMLGTGIIATMDIAGGWKLLGALAWSLASATELFVITSGYARFQRLRIYGSGDVELLDAEGRWCSAKILSGSIVLRRVAWLRLAPVTGRPYAEVVREKTPEDAAWRRFQVIWRHLGAAP